MNALPATIGVAEFDALHDEPARWQALLEDIAGAPVVPATEGTVLVALVGRERVVKLYPPFLRDHFAFEHAMLQHLHGRLPVPTPKLLDHGERDGWPWHAMSFLPGTPLTEAWPALDEGAKCRLLRDIGTLAAAVHTLPTAPVAALAPAWPDFIARQRTGCLRRQQRTGLPPHLLAQVEDFIAGPLPDGPDVLLTGEYTPMNLLHGPDGLAGMYDFGDGLVGPRAYDALGPLCFLAAGHAARCAAFFEGFGMTVERLPLMRLLLLHRYSHLPAQIAVPGWQQAPDFEALAALVWPGA